MPESLLLEKFDSPLLQATQQIRMGHPEKAAEIFAKEKEFGLAGDAAMRAHEAAKAKEDPGAASACLDRAREYYGMHVQECALEGSFRSAGRSALKMGDLETALDMFVKGFWFEDASRAAAQLGRHDKEREYAEKAKVPRLKHMEDAGVFTAIARERELQSRALRR
jgi:hypothetical protein